MKKVFLWVCFLFFMLVGVVQAQELEYYKFYAPKIGMSADEIMKIMYHNKYSLFAHDYESSNNRTLYVDSSGFTREKIAKRQRIILGGKAGISYKDIVVVTAPTQAKGLAILTWTYEDAERDQDTWLWIPALKKIRKVSASESDDAFMGSDLTVEEVSTRRFEDETYTLIGERNFKGYTFEHTGELKYNNRPCFVIECIPKKPHWYYAKRTVWVDKETGGSIFEEYYDKNGKLFKTLFREWTWYEEDSKKYPMQIAWECKDLRTGHRTVILPESTKYDQDLDERIFTTRELERSKW